MSLRHPGSRYHAKLDQRRWRRTRLEILDAANWRCAACGGYANTVDHVVPLHMGGDAWAESNLQVLCGGPGGCHAEKTRAENSGPPIPGREAWRELVAEIANS